MFPAALFTMSRIWQQSGCPSMDEWIEKVWYIYLVDDHSATKKNELFPFVTTWMDSGKDEERQIPCDLAYMWNLKSRTNEQT